jgi:hypothetical protein
MEPFPMEYFALAADVELELPLVTTGSGAAESLEIFRRAAGCE